MGLELLGSSNVVVPGFGSVMPTSIVLELRSALPLSGLCSSECYGFMLIYEIESPRRERNLRRYHERFPLAFGHEVPGRGDRANG
jgi:hypothetical protein